MRILLLPLLLMFASMACFGDTSTPEFPPEKFKRYRERAEQGKATYQYLLGAAYEAGWGIVPQDYLKAAKWYHKAAEQGHTGAQHNLGLMYMCGDMGLPEDYILAYMWFNLAVSQGNEMSKDGKRLLSKDMMTKEQIAEAQKMSREWMAKHSEKE